jgi:hypothetical protein
LESFESSLSGAAQNTWARLQGFGSAIASGFNNLCETIRPYAPYITMAAGVVLVVAGSFVTFGAAAPAGAVLVGGTMAGVGMGASIGVGLGSVGLGLGLEAFALHNLGIMNYPQQLSFRERHTQQYTQQQTLESKMEKGSGHYGEDAAEEQLEQAEITRDRIVETGGLYHQRAEKQAKEWLKKRGETEIFGPIWHVGSRSYHREQPDLTSENYIVECKTGRERSTDEIMHFWDQANEYPELAEKEGRKLVIWIDKVPSQENEDYWSILRWLRFKGAKVLKGPYGEDIFGDG